MMLSMSFPLASTALHTISRGQHCSGSSQQTWVRKMSHAQDVDLTNLCLGHQTHCSLQCLHLAPQPSLPLMQDHQGDHRAPPTRVSMLSFPSNSTTKPTSPASPMWPPLTGPCFWRQSSVTHLICAFHKKTGNCHACEALTKVTEMLLYSNFFCVFKGGRLFKKIATLIKITLLEAALLEC